MGSCEIGVLLEDVYPELRRFARPLVRRGRPNHTLSIMTGELRRVLISHARRRLAGKRTASSGPVEAGGMAGRDEKLEERLLVDEASERPAEVGRRAQTVCLHFFAGLTAEETASARGASVNAVERNWGFARPWLYGEITRR